MDWIQAPSRGTNARTGGRSRIIWRGGKNRTGRAAMATRSDVRRICMSLPGTVEHPDRFAFEVPVKGKLKGYVWVWMERIDPKKARVPQPKVIAVRTANLDDKDFLIRAAPKKYFTEPHYNGFPAVLVRLAEVTVRELRPLITEAWQTQTKATSGTRSGQPAVAPSGSSRSDRRSAARQRRG